MTPTGTVPANRPERTDPNDMTIGQRIAAPTPKLFKTIRKVSWLLGAIGAALLTSGAVLPALVPIGTILTTAGAVGTAVASATVDPEAMKQQAAPPGQP